jgi:hypothetical protein
VIVPPGAVNAQAVFTVSIPGQRAPSLPGARQPVTPVWDVVASGQAGPVTVFNRPLQLVVHYRQAQPAVIASWDGQEWVNMATTIDAGRRTATATAPHLTPVVAFATATMVPEAPPPSGGFPLGAALFAVAALGVVGTVAYYARTRLAPAPARLEAPAAPATAAKPPVKPGKRASRAPRKPGTDQ